MFITVHGIDGTGKTSTVVNTVTALEHAGIPSKTFDDIEAHYTFGAVLLEKEIEPVPALHSSLVKKMWQSRLVRQAQLDGTSVVKDRWHIDVLASSLFKGNHLQPEPVGTIAQPDLSVVLTCDEDIRRQRISLRGNPTADDLLQKLPGTRPAFFEDFLLSHVGRYATNAIIIDTTELTVNGVSDIIVATATEL